jgi:hypothetical protein
VDAGPSKPTMPAPTQTSPRTAPSSKSASSTQQGAVHQAAKPKLPIVAADIDYLESPPHHQPGSPSQWGTSTAREEAGQVIGSLHLWEQLSDGVFNELSDSAQNSDQDVAMSNEELADVLLGSKSSHCQSFFTSHVSISRSLKAPLG